MPQPASERTSDTATLFAPIESQTSERDRQSIVAVRDAVQRAVGEYGYLEIGSHLGGTLQAFVADPACTHLWSIDLRPAVQADERGTDWAYPENSTARMVSLLAALDPAVGDRLRTFDSDTSGVAKGAIVPAPRLLLVDGEHTDTAVAADAAFCRQVADPAGAVVMFHDAQIVYRGLQRTLTAWSEAGVEFRAYALADCVMVVELGLAIHRDQAIGELLADNHVAYLTSLAMNDEYREIARRFPARQYWRVRRSIARRLGRPSPLA